MRHFVDLLRDLGVTDASSFTSHCFRHGNAIDVLEEHGLAPMLKFCQWSTPAAACPYPSADEQTARALGRALLESSGDER